MYQIASFMSSLFAFIPILLLLCCQSHALGSGYTISNISESPDGNSITAQLQLIQNNSVNNSLYGPDIQSSQLLVRYESNDSLRVYIMDAKQRRWEVPSDILPRYGGVNSSDDAQNHTHELLFNYSNNPFGFSITRCSSGETLFNSTANATGYSLVFEDQYLEVSTALPSTASLYRLGESTMQTFLLNANQNYTLWNSDIGNSSTNVDLYGSHPFYLDVRAGGVAHGVLLLNSNGMDVEYGGSFLTYRTNGGVLDLYFFSGPSPLAVVQQYTTLIGRPAAMSYWSFGKFGAIFASIPAPIVVAMYCLLFGYVAGGGLCFLQFCNLNSFRTKFTLGFSLFLGLSVPQYFNEFTVSSGHGPVHTHG